MSMDLIVRVAPLDHADLAPELAHEDDELHEAWFAAFCAKYHSNEPAHRVNYPLRGALLLNTVLRQAGAIFEAGPEQHGAAPADGDAGPRGAHDEVPSYKLSSNDGWHVTKAEAALLRDRLAAVLDRGVVVEARGYRYELRADAADPDDRDTYEWLREVVAFFHAAAQHDGFEVW